MLARVAIAVVVVTLGAIPCSGQNNADPDELGVELGRPADSLDDVPVPGARRGAGSPSRIVSAPASGAPSAASAPPAPPKPAAPKPPPQPWKVNLFDNDFSYKKAPDAPYFLGEELKDIRLDDWFDSLDEETKFSAGGELRYRLMDERNRLRPGGPAHGDYDLWRWRQYVDLKYGQEFRAYVEMIDASMFRNPLPVTGIDVNRWDLQNFFVDVQFAERDDKPVYLRVGRQELLYGSQRLVSPLDWANTRRNFEGIKAFSKGDIWDFDLFFTRTVNTATFGDGPVARFDNEFDSPNLNHLFSGFWSTYKGWKDQVIDLYWLWDWDSSLPAPGYSRGNRHTLATRWLGKKPVLDSCDDPWSAWLVDIEGGYQFGTNYNQNVQAGFVTAGLGHQFPKLPWEPEIWAYYDWASGDRNPNDGVRNTFNQMYGLVHAYLGQIDNLARQNITDLNGKIVVKPRKDLAFETWYHWFNLASDGDVLYQITGQPLGTPGTGWNVGSELDLIATYTYSPNFNVQFGYLWFWYGSFVENNSPRGDATQLYLQTTFRY